MWSSSHNSAANPFQMNTSSNVWIQLAEQELGLRSVPLRIQCDVRRRVPNACSLSQRQHSISHALERAAEESLKASQPWRCWLVKPASPQYVDGWFRSEWYVNVISLCTRPNGQTQLQSCSFVGTILTYSQFALTPIILWWINSGLNH